MSADIEHSPSVWLVLYGGTPWSMHLTEALAIERRANPALRAGGAKDEDFTVDGPYRRWHPPADEPCVINGCTYEHAGEYPLCPEHLHALVQMANGPPAGAPMAGRRGDPTSRRASLGARVTELRERIPALEKQARKTPAKTMHAERAKVAQAKVALDAARIELAGVEIEWARLCELEGITPAPALIRGEAKP